MDRFRPRHFDQNPNAPDPITDTTITDTTTVVQTATNVETPVIAPLAPPPALAAQQPVVQQADIVVQQPIIQQSQDQTQDNVLQEHWLKAYWRPACAWMYILICFMDFVGFPILSMIQPIVSKSFGVIVPYTPWIPLTLNQSGMVHMAFGAILGVSAWTRGMNRQ